MYLIFGASGFLGPYLIKEILKQTNDSVIATYNSQKAKIEDSRLSWRDLDLTDNSKIAEFCLDLKKLNQKLKVIYLSAVSSPDLVEKDPQSSRKINVDALPSLIEKIPNLETFYLASTDSVYGESVNDYIFSEDDQLSPINEYAKQKSEAENIVLNSGQNVARYPLMYGPSLCNKKHLYDAIVENLSNSKEMEMFSDSYRNCLSFASVAQYTIELIEKYKSKKIGIVNLCSDKAISRYELALIIARKLSFDENLVKPINSASQNQIFISKRANKTIMNNDKLKKLLDLDVIAV